jgi:hypothetical protein
MWKLDEEGYSLVFLGEGEWVCEGKGGVAIVWERASYLVLCIRKNLWYDDDGLDLSWCLDLYQEKMFDSGMCIMDLSTGCMLMLDDFV